MDMQDIINLVEEHTKVHKYSSTAKRQETQLKPD